MASEDRGDRRKSQPDRILVRVKVMKSQEVVAEEEGLPVGTVGLQTKEKGRMIGTATAVIATLQPRGSDHRGGRQNQRADVDDSPPELGAPRQVGGRNGAEGPRTKKNSQIVMMN